MRISDRYILLYSLNVDLFLGDVFKAIETHTEPKFQSIILTSLPPEVLHIIMDNEDKAVPRLFGATCRYLNDVARPYIFKVCRTDVIYFVSA